LRIFAPPGRATILVDAVSSGDAMTRTVSTADIRQRIGDILDRVALRHDEFIVQRKGKPLAAIVPVARLEQMRRFARAHALELLERRYGSEISDKEAAEVGAAARVWARRRLRSARVKRK
jgi:prevent-host-death family protein